MQGRSSRKNRKKTADIKRQSSASVPLGATDGPLTERQSELCDHVGRFLPGLEVRRLAGSPKLGSSIE